jgi:uncharacterized protein YqgC (DUF456 family)
MLTVIFGIISTILILAGLAGIILPFLPPVPIAWLGLFIFAVGTHFERISIATTVVFFVVMVLTIVLDNVASLLGAKKFKASKWGMLGAAAGSMLGIFVFGPVGIILGPFLGAMLGELIGGRPVGGAVKAAWGTVLGIIAGSLVKIIVILIMLGFLFASWF